MKKFRTLFTLMLVLTLVIALGNSSVSAITYKYTTHVSNIDYKGSTFTVKADSQYGIASSFCGQNGTKKAYVKARHKDIDGNYFYSDPASSIVTFGTTKATAKTELLNKGKLDSVAGYHATETNNGSITYYTSTK